LPADPAAADALPAAPETVRRIRSRAVWSLSLFAAALPASLIGIDPTSGTAPSVLLATVFWASGIIMAVLASAGALRHWHALSVATRWLGIVPLIGVGLVLLLLGLLALAIA
jgi:hypothetical protein